MESYEIPEIRTGDGLRKVNFEISCIFRKALLQRLFIPKLIFMNWKLIVQLSLFGLAMAIATVYWIPSRLEPVFWIAIFIICAYLIARNCIGNFFLHGLLVSILNSVWITAFHVLLYRTYIDGHSREAEMLLATPMPKHPRLMMLFTGPVVGIISGLVLGLFAFIASKIWKPRVAV